MTRQYISAMLLVLSGMLLSAQGASGELIFENSDFEAGTLANRLLDVCIDDRRTGVTLLDDDGEIGRHLVFYAAGGSIAFKDIVLQATTPDISVASGHWKETVQIQLQSPGMDGDIYYTLDGTDPESAGRQLFIDPLLVEEAATIRARVLKTDGAWTRALEARLLRP